MEVFALNFDQFRYIQIHRIYLETQFHLKMILEEEFKLTGTFVTVSGEKRNIRKLKNLLKGKCGDNCYNKSTSDSIPLITLSDTDSETQEGCETLKRVKKQTKHKFQSSECSTSLAAKKLVTEGNSSEILVLNDQTAPSSKRTRFGPSSPSEKYVPLYLAKNIKETSAVKMNCKNKSIVNAANEEKSSFATENVVPWQSQIKVATCGNTNSFYAKNTSAIPFTSTTPHETDIISTRDDSDRIIRDTFVSNNKPSASTCIMNDSFRRMPSFPNEKDITVLDDSITEITVLEGEMQPTSQSNSQLNKMYTKPLNNLKSTKMHSSLKKMTVFNKRNNIVKSGRRTVLLPKWENASQKLIVTEHNLQKVVAGSNLPMSDGLAHQFPKTLTNLHRAIWNRSRMQASVFSKRNNVVKLGSRTVHRPRWENENQKLITTNHDLTNGGLQNVANGSNFPMPDGLAHQVPKTVTNLNRAISNSSQMQASVFNNRNNIELVSQTVHHPKWENENPKLITTNHDLTNGGLQNVATGSNLLMSDGLAHEFPKTVTNLNRAISNSSQMQASVFSKRNNIELVSQTVHHPKWENENPKLFTTNHDLTNGGLQNVATGSNFSMPDGLALQFPIPSTVKLRPLVIDGSNIARAHGLTKGAYSCKGIKISVDYFLRRGHTEVTVFIPKFRKHQLHGKIPTTDANILEELEKTGHIAYAPARKINGKTLSCYNARFVVQLATETGGIIVSNDNFRSIMLESEAFKKTIEERLLMFCFVGDIIMFPEDPLGRDGPRLKEFLAFPPEHSRIL